MNDKKTGRAEPLFNSDDSVINRLSWLDYARGLIMVLMAVDHAHYFIIREQVGEFWGVALPFHQNIISFLSRFIAHICAPGFFFLLGIGIVLFSESRLKLGWSKAKISGFLIKRGLILILLQFLLENMAWGFGYIGKAVIMTRPPGGGGQNVFLHFGVLQCLGFVMIVWALILRLKTVYVVILSAAAIFATQIFIPGPESAGIVYPAWLRIIFIPGQTGIMQVFYPLIPWLGIAGLGIVFGKNLIKDKGKAIRSALYGGVIFSILFFLVRAIGSFGNFHPAQNGWINFLNVTKYPPSLAYILLTIGSFLLVIFVLSKININSRINLWLRPFHVYGNTALFFYITHLFIYMFFGFAFLNGSTYPMMYIMWLAGLVILYPLCSWYKKFKQKKSRESIWRFF